ncbi:DUF4828 domain-containing protein [uncultured Secundilactobacillus sp.]|uniref:DUF4828 domain-containing protein n=1 Tax=uncultured Secundilactobacillus sp. TaxID=2813935 RepID=UPI002583E0DA|nr:DUF4828 domain-containing protein [uncultured Secundilactobacillus sp.]
MRRKRLIEHGKSLLFGLAKRSAKKQPAPASPMIFVGSWTLHASDSNRHHSLLIGPDLTVIIDNHTIPGNVEKVTANELLFLDRFGYHLAIKCNETQPIEMYDEAGEMTYTIEGHNSPTDPTNNK